MNSPTVEATQEPEHPIVDGPISPVKPINLTNNTPTESADVSRRASKFSNLVTLVAPSSRSTENSGKLRPSQTSGNTRPLSTLSESTRKRQDPRNAAAAVASQSPDEAADDIGRFVFFHSREKRYLDGLRRKAIPLQTFALSLSLGVAIGCVGAIVLSLAFRVFWNFQENSSLGVI